MVEGVKCWLLIGRNFWLALSFRYWLLIDWGLLMMTSDWLIYLGNIWSEGSHPLCAVYFQVLGPVCWESLMMTSERSIYLWRWWKYMECRISSLVCCLFFNLLPVRWKKLLPVYCSSHHTTPTPSSHHASFFLQIVQLNLLFCTTKVFNIWSSIVIKNKEVGVSDLIVAMTIQNGFLLPVPPLL